MASSVCPLPSAAAVSAPVVSSALFPPVMAPLPTECVSTASSGSNSSVGSQSVSTSSSRLGSPLGRWLLAPLHSRLLALPTGLLLVRLRPRFARVRH
jgi:hypothetical protein